MKTDFDILNVELSSWVKKLRKSEFLKFSEERNIRATMRELILAMIQFPMSQLSPSLLGEVVEVTNDRFMKDYKAWFLAVAYFHAESEGQRVATYNDLKRQLVEINKKAFDKEGMGLLPSSIYQGRIIRSIYLSENKELIELFREYLPIPPSELFIRHGEKVPETVMAREKEAEHIISKVIAERKPLEMEQFLKKTRTIQRFFRGFKKHQEDIARAQKLSKSSFTVAEINKDIQAANIPYYPQCTNKGLAERLYCAAFQVPNFSTLRHLTAKSSLASILDGGLYGRRNLAQHYIPFRPAALAIKDRKNGDANAICLAPQFIDEKALKSDTIDIVFDFEKFRQDPLEFHNPCIFYKQKDLEYGLEKVRTVKVGEVSLSFSHTSSRRLSASDHVQFKLLKNAKSNLDYFSDWIGYAQVPYKTMISTDVRVMSAIQALQFFRFIDSLQNIDPDEEHSEAIAKVYADIAKLSDRQLVQLLTKLRNAMTDTAEFNFYGAYQINPALISAIKYYPAGFEDDPRSYSLHINELIESLEKGETSLLVEAKSKLPELFNSYTFVKYLSSRITNVVTRKSLLDIMGSCSSLPTYRKYLSMHNDLDLSSIHKQKGIEYVASAQAL